MPSAIRLKRIGDRLRQEIAEMLLREINDPRLRQIFITDVRIDRELAYADVYVSAVEGSGRSKEILAGLEAAGGFFRRALANGLNCASRLRFPGINPEQADHIEKCSLVRVKDNSTYPTLQAVERTKIDLDIDGEIKQRLDRLKRLIIHVRPDGMRSVH
jgi:ribosome-binding factor A